MRFLQVSHYARASDEVRALFAGRWPNFSLREMASRGDGSIRIECEALDKLQRLRSLWGGPLTVNSAYRDPRYNRRVGGAPLSQHKKGRAFDISVRGMSADQRERLRAFAVAAGFRAFGGYNTFLHVDNRERPAFWGKRWAWPKSKR